jgi:hypothetical protein
MFHHLICRRIRLRPPTIRNTGVFRSTNNIKTRYMFMLSVTLEDVVDGLVGDVVGWVLHLIESKKKLGQNQ